MASDIVFTVSIIKYMHCLSTILTSSPITRLLPTDMPGSFSYPIHISRRRNECDKRTKPGMLLSLLGMKPTAYLSMHLSEKRREREIEKKENQKRETGHVNGRTCAGDSISEREGSEVTVCDGHAINQIRCFWPRRCAKALSIHTS